MKFLFLLLILALNVNGYAQGLSISESSEFSGDEKKFGRTSLALGVLGRGGVIGLDLDLGLSPHLALQAGIGYLGGTNMADGPNAPAIFVFPLSVSYFMTTGNWNPFLSLGAHYVTADTGAGSSIYSKGFTFIPSAGLECISDEGIFLRLAFNYYFLKPSNVPSVSPWVPGLQFGKAF